MQFIMSTAKWGIISIVVTVAIGVPAYFIAGDVVLNEPPIPSQATINPVTAGPYYVGNSIEFSARDSTPSSDSTITSYEWEFDGKKENRNHCGTCFFIPLQNILLVLQ